MCHVSLIIAHNVFEVRTGSVQCAYLCCYSCQLNLCNVQDAVLACQLIQEFVPIVEKMFTSATNAGVCLCISI